jgi:hypothetical protein
MPIDPIVIVHLRRPKNKKDPRNDPFWECGSFGVTGCHKDNLLHHKGIDELQGVRLAFVQGGRDGFKLVFLTPPVSSVVKHRSLICEAKWQPAAMPLKYRRALLLVRNDGNMISGMEDVLHGVQRDTHEERFSSRFRSRKQPLNQEFPLLAGQIAKQFDSLYLAARRAGTLAETYDEALPSLIESPDRDRHETYRQMLDEAGGILVARDPLLSGPGLVGCSGSKSDNRLQRLERPRERSGGCS